MIPPILPQSVQVIFDNRALLRIVEIGGAVTDYELNKSQLRLLACQAVALALKGKPMQVEEKLDGRD